GELTSYITLSQETGVGIASVSGSTVDLGTAEGRLHAHILGAFAESERSRMTERVKRKALELATTGAWPGKRVYGYTAEGPEIVEEEAAIIRELAERVLAGESINALASELEGRGITTIKSTQWRASTIIQILKSSRIA